MQRQNTLHRDRPQGLMKLRIVG